MGAFGKTFGSFHKATLLNLYKDAPRGSILTEDGKFYLTTEDEQFYLAQEIYTIPEEV